MITPSKVWQPLKRAIPRPLKARVKDVYLQRTLDRAIARMKELPHGVVPDRALLDDLQAGWNNVGMAARTDYLEEVARHAASTPGPILECGSGLTTFLVGALGGRRGVRILTLEHMAEWRSRVAAVLQRHQLDRVQLHLSPLRSYGGYDWYDLARLDLPATISLIICDGPPGSTLGGRYGLLPLVSDRLTRGSTILLDDVERDSEVQVLRRWQGEIPLTVTIREMDSGSFAIAERT